MRLFLILLFTMPVYSFVSAESQDKATQNLNQPTPYINQVSVNIDGVQYFCSTTPGQPNNCNLNALEDRYIACKAANTPSYCFRDVFSSRPTTCDPNAWGEVCNRLCIQSNSPSYCYRKCFD